METTNRWISIKRMISVNALALSNVVVGFALQVIVASNLGPTDIGDYYMVVITVPIIALNLATAIFSASVVPIVALTSKIGIEATGQACFALLRIAKFVGLIATIISAIPIFYFSVPENLGYGRVGVLLAAAPIAYFGVIAGCSASVLHAFRLHSRSTALLVLPALGAIAGGVTLGGDVISFLVGQSVGQLLAASLMGHFIRKEARLTPNSEMLSSVRSEMIRFGAPIILGGALYQFLPFIERTVAAGMAPGSAIILGIGSRIANSLGPLVGVGVAAVIFPKLAEYSLEKNYAEAARLCFSSCLWVSLVLALGYVVAYLYAAPIIELLFVRGSFDSHAGAEVADVLLLLYPGAAAAVVGQIIARSFTAILRETKTQSIITVMAFLLYLAFVYGVGADGVRTLSFYNSGFWIISVTACAIVLKIHLRKLIKQNA